MGILYSHAHTHTLSRTLVPFVFFSFVLLKFLPAEPREELMPIRHCRKMMVTIGRLPRNPCF